MHKFMPHPSEIKMHLLIIGFFTVLWFCLNFFLLNDNSNNFDRNAYSAFVIAFSLLIPQVFVVSKIALFFDKSPVKSNYILDSVLKFYFLLPVKRKTIAFWIFTNDIIFSFLYCSAFFISSLFAIFSKPNRVELNILLFFVSPLATNLLSISLFLLLYSFPHFVKNKMLKSLSELLYGLLPFFLLIILIIVLALAETATASNDNLIASIVNLYKNSLWSLTYLLISIILLISSYIAVFASFYRQEG
ncbi:hypothetical protein Csac_2501 [Caldicellulosiruptor saccharolyticus DSM 8903]|uniref:Uncharacterized protein n=1 Tax=Caldicellulosiruptor saccharolyticus (strain ATCC 43494 / DSM 8903 / Tp8T 6331) TaxID=351627 RepID=A4XME3_CALS8|nr:hypothetical protein Csac_2501 [Caldicellulosiruptor saccharolyticus DSM 8903]